MKKNGIFLILSLLLASILVPAGCGQQTGGAGKGKPEQKLVVAVSSDVANWDLTIGVPACGRPLSPAMKYSDPGLKLTPDPKGARALLAQAGYKDTDGDGILEKGGKALAVTAKLAPWSPRQKIEAEAIQGQLRAVGIDMKVQMMEQGAIDTAEKTGGFDILLRTGYFTWGDYPHHLKIHTSKNMYSHWANEEYDRLIAEGESALDEAAKNEAYRRAQQLILDQVPAYYTIHEEKVVAVRNNVKGYKITAEDPWLNLAGVTIEK